MGLGMMGCARKVIRPVLCDMNIESGYLVDSISTSRSTLEKVARRGARFAVVNAGISTFINFRTSPISMMTVRLALFII
jgi:hypothetical protein